MNQPKLAPSSVAIEKLFLPIITLAPIGVEIRLVPDEDASLFTHVLQYGFLYH